MRTLQVFDPAMCCSTGVCGPAIDETLVRFAADMKWLRNQGIKAERFNLSQTPDAFVRNPVIQEALNKTGVAGLPLFLADQKLIHSGSYPDRKQLGSWFSLADIELLPKIPSLAAPASKKSEIPCGDDNCFEDDSGTCC
jgi:hypothetical protein